MALNPGGFVAGRLARIDAADIRTFCMLALTFSTGISDAVGYLALDRVFTANMTGNVVILGMGVAGSDGLPVLGPVLALVGFMAGAAAGGRLVRHETQRWAPKVTRALFAVAGVLGATGIMLLVVPIDHRLTMALATILLAVPMGLQAAVARHVAVADVTTVVVTSTITGLACDSRFGAAREQLWVRRVAAVLAIGAGALVGALLLQVGVGVGVLASAVITVVVAAIGHQRQAIEDGPDRGAPASSSPGTSSTPATPIKPEG